MNTVLVIAKREWLGLFATPFAWSLLALVQIILGVFFFLNQLDAFINAQPQLIGMNSRFGITAFVVAPLYDTASILLMFVIPLICMNAIAGERRGATLPLLFSAPVTMRAIVLGKFLALFAFITLLCILISTLPLSLLLAANLDTGLVAAASLGLLLTAASYTAASLYISSLMTQPSLAAISSFALLVALNLLRSANQSGMGPVVDVLTYLSPNQHGAAFLRGVVNSPDIAYFVLFVGGFLIFTIRQLDTLRTHG